MNLVLYDEFAEVVEVEILVPEIAQIFMVGLYVVYKFGFNAVKLMSGKLAGNFAIDRVDAEIVFVLTMLTEDFLCIFFPCLQSGLPGGWISFDFSFEFVLVVVLRRVFLRYLIKWFSWR